VTSTSQVISPEPAPERSRDPWSIETVTASLITRSWIPAVVVVMPMAAVRFFYHQCIQWAAALAYYTLIGLVPMLAVVFTIIKVAGFHDDITSYLVVTIAAGSEEVASHIVAFIDHTNLRAVAVVSVIAAFLAVLAIMSNAEMCFNQIWGGVRGRSLKRKLGSFVKLAVIAPLLLLLAMTVTAFLQPGSWLYPFFDSWYLGDAVLFGLRVLPYALILVSFTLLYTGLPNTNVSRRSATVGAMVAGMLLFLAQWAYVKFVIRLVRYSAVYGALWQVPILLAWIYIAWSVILYGAEVSRAHQELMRQRLSQRRRGRRTPDTERDG
jgi:membrane protein